MQPQLNLEEGDEEVGVHEAAPGHIHYTIVVDRCCLAEEDEEDSSLSTTSSVLQSGTEDNHRDGDEGQYMHNEGG